MAAPFGVLTMLVGIAALQQLPGLANPEEAFARSMMSAMPVGLRALMMSAILAAVVTSGESSVNAATALFVNDVCKRFVARPIRSVLPPPVAGVLRRARDCRAGAGAQRAAHRRVHPARVHDSHAGGHHRPDGPLLARRQRQPARPPPSSSARWPCSDGRIFGDPRAIDPFWIAAPVTFAGVRRRLARRRVHAGTEHDRLTRPHAMSDQPLCPHAGRRGRGDACTPSRVVLAACRATPAATARIARPPIWRPSSRPPACR